MAASLAVSPHETHFGSFWSKVDYLEATLTKNLSSQNQWALSNMKRLLRMSSCQDETQELRHFDRKEEVMKTWSVFEIQYDLSRVFAGLLVAVGLSLGLAAQASADEVPAAYGATSSAASGLASGSASGSASAPVAAPATLPVLAKIVSCNCEASQCGACEVETGVSFYTEKCGPANSKVKSCKKPSCKPAENHKQCMAELKAKQEAGRVPASAAAPARSGEIILVVGDTRVRRFGQARDENLTQGATVFAGDLLMTGVDGRIRVRFPELSEMFVSPNTSIRIQQATGSSGTSRKIMMDLMKGKIRSRVQGRYGEDPSKLPPGESASTFQIRTRTAVAGVRGTDFVASFEPGQREWTTEIRTLTGEVALAGLRGDGHPMSVTAKTYAAHVAVVPAKPGGAEPTDEELRAAPNFLTPVFKMSDEDVRELDRDTMFALREPVGSDSLVDAGRKPAQADSSLCSVPSGQFNDCSWTCEGKNPSGASRCRADLPGVNCVRRLCRANGKWAEPTVLPTRSADECQVDRVRVGTCGAY
jgi:hypothetical protein